MPLGLLIQAYPVLEISDWLVIWTLFLQIVGWLILFPPLSLYSNDTFPIRPPPHYLLKIATLPRISK